MIVAIDPGINGAAAALDPERGFIDVIDLPTIPAARGRRREINTNRLRYWLNAVHPDRIVMENVHSMPKQGIAGTFYLGVAIGMIKTVCRMRPCDFELVEPQVWKDYFDLTGCDKEASRQLAIELFPHPGHECLARKKDHDRAEAMLIAWWANRPIIGRNWMRVRGASVPALPVRP